MNQILKLINTRELYVHLILFKIYLDTRGRTNQVYRGNLQTEVKELFGGEFENESYNTALNYIYTEGYSSYSSANNLTQSGRQYFENWICDFIDLTEEQKIEINSKIPEKIKKYLGIANTALTVVKNAKDFFENLAN